MTRFLLWGRVPLGRGIKGDALLKKSSKLKVQGDKLKERWGRNHLRRFAPPPPAEDRLLAALGEKSSIFSCFLDDVFASLFPHAP